MTNKVGEIIQFSKYRPDTPTANKRMITVVALAEEKCKEAIDECKAHPGHVVYQHLAITALREYTNAVILLARMLLPEGTFPKSIT